MDPYVQEWRTLGGEGTSSGPVPSSAAPVVGRARRLPVHLTPGTIMVVACGALGVVVAAVAVLIALVPAPGGVSFDVRAGVAGGVAQPGASPAFDAPTGAGLRAVAGGRAVLIVDVEGAVRQPGIIEVPSGSRVGDALRLAGGFGPTADLGAASASLNLAAPVEDGSKILVPAIGGSPAVVPGATAPAVAAGSSLVDLNAATQAELEALPGIGPVSAGKIIAARTGQPFTSVDELRSRKVLGDATFEKVKDLVTVAR